MRMRERSLRPVSPRRALRSQRNSATSPAFVVADSPEFLNTTDWDALTHGQSLFLSRRYQAVLRSAGPRSMRSRYGLIYDDGVAIAALVTHILVRDAAGDIAPVSPTGAGSRTVETDWIQRVPPSAAVAHRYLVCGDVFAGGWHGIALHPERSLGTLWPVITEFLDRIKRQESFHPDQDYVVIKDIQSVIASDTRALRACNYRQMNASAPMLLTMPTRWTCYNDYLEHLNIRHRTGAYRVARELNRAGLALGKINDLRAIEGRLHSLYRSVQRNGAAQLASLPVGFLASLAERLGPEEYRCSGYYRGEELVAFVMSLRDRDTSICYCLGWDRKLLGPLPMLPALLHAAIGDALEMGCHRLDYGRTALKAKAHAGAHPEASEIWVQQAGQQLPLRLDDVVEPLSHSPIPDPVVTFSL